MRSIRLGSNRGALMGIVAFGVALALLGGLPAAAEKPPANTTYFTLFLGLEDPFFWGADCVVFSRTEMCSLYGMCGSWFFTEESGKETAIAYEMSFQHNGVSVFLDGKARLDSRGRKNTLSGVAYLDVDGRKQNFGFTGRPLGPQACEQLLVQWKAWHRPPDGEQRNDACLERANFGDPDDSPYILPFSVGSAHEFLQSYCTTGSHRNQLAYDIPMPLGVDILAARAGVVMDLRESHPDDGLNCQDHNFVLVQHDDGSVAFYAHLMQHGVLVDVGDRVEQGETIALNGNSCTNYSPLLHFGVYRSWPPTEGDDLPVNFSNALGPLDARGGLMWRQTYTALPY